MLQVYRDHAAEREKEGIPPRPLDAQQIAELVELIKNPPAGEQEYLIELLTQHVPAGVDAGGYKVARINRADSIGGTGINQVARCYLV